jgi:hypothetical protein
MVRLFSAAVVTAEHPFEGGGCAWWILIRFTAFLLEFVDVFTQDGLKSSSILLLGYPSLLRWRVKKRDRDCFFRYPKAAISRKESCTARSKSILYKGFSGCSEWIKIGRRGRILSPSPQPKEPLR